MLAPLSFGGHSAPTGHEKLLKLSEVAQIANVHANTIRRATDAGVLPCFRLNGNARRFRLIDVQRWLGLNPPDAIVTDEGEQQGKQPIRIAAVVRVSSHGQASRVGSSDKSSLEHQEQRVATFIRQRFGKNCEVTWYKSIGSGLDFNRVALLRCLEDVLAGKFSGGYIVATDFTRICRFGIKLVEHLAKLGNCKIVYTMDEAEAEQKGEAESLTDEILSILCHYTARASGRKAKQILSVKVAPTTLSLIFKLSQQGYSTRLIVQRLKREELDKGICGKPITRNVVARLLRENKANIPALVPMQTSPAYHSFARFCQLRLRAASPESKLSFKSLQQAYAQWCEVNNELPIGSHRTLAKHLSCTFPTVKLGYSHSGTRLYRGLSLLAVDCS